jgi:hypothetical protein
MNILKCKICGGDIRASNDAIFGVCDSCGTTSTLPKVNDERKTNLFNRANHLRMQNEFDRAIQAYENILMEDSTDAEAHWCIVLSRFGIVYVEDPVSRQRIPTCHRMQRESILRDVDYIATLQHAPDEYTKSLYEEEAQRISEIQKGILTISATEEPYDIFICYKETSEGGSRTKDSVLAQDIYSLLEKEGYRVFFSRISLESKLGQQYEPYIYSALNSAKVMLVIGTKSEHINSVWVKNEWSRFLDIMKNDSSKKLIPCFKDINPYDLPDEMSMLQSQDMSKIGASQDLLHGIEKIISKRKGNINKSSSNVEGLTQNGYKMLEESNWKKARDCFDKAIHIDSRFAPAYIGKLCAELKLNNEEELANSLQDLDSITDFKKALQFADCDYLECLNGYRESNLKLIEQQREKNLSSEGQKSRGQYFQKLQERYDKEKEEREKREREAELQKIEEKKQEELQQEEQWRIDQKQMEADKLERERREAEKPIVEAKKNKTAIVWAVIIVITIVVLYFSFSG